MYININLILNNSKFNIINLKPILLKASLSPLNKNIKNILQPLINNIMNIII